MREEGGEVLTECHMHLEWSGVILLKSRSTKKAALSTLAEEDSQAQRGGGPRAQREVGWRWYLHPALSGSEPALYFSPKPGPQ